MLNIGCHLSSSRGFTAMAEECIKIGANTFQYFTRNPRGGKAKEIDSQDLEKFLKIYNEKNFKPIIAHAPYTMNLCSSTESIRIYSKDIFKDDIKRCEYIPGSYYNFHPGSHTGQGIETGITEIAEALNEIISQTQSTTILLETMTGKGSEVGGKFEEIAEIIDRVELKDKIGVCLDTCHTFDAGYDIVNNLDNVLEEFDKIIGIKNLKAIHLNDSKNTLGSKKDRHERIGQGQIGFEAIIKIVRNKYLKDLVFILETPQENIEGYSQEIRMIKNTLESEIL